MTPFRPRPDHISRELFLQFRSPRRGSGNPEVMTNPVWLWMIEQRLYPYAANKTFDGPRSEDAGPCWSYSRYGRTETTLPDGRLIRIGGEHEDWYDADYYVYNDVFVTDAAGRTEIYGYSEEAFPPTDSHTADLVGDRIIVIGNWSYRHLWKEKAQVLALDTTSYGFAHIEAGGVSPPWLHKHSSELVENGRAIIVRGGHIISQRWPVRVENIDDWRLDVDAGRWERLTSRAWPRFAFVRADRKQNHLYWLRSSSRSTSTRKRKDPSEFLAERLRELGPTPRLDLLETLYVPDVPHSKVPEDEFRVRRITVEGVSVRYVEKDECVQLTVEGALPMQIVEMLRADLHEKLTTIENSSIDCVPIMVD